MSDALSSAKSLPDAQRAALMATADDHLDEDLADAQASPPVPEFSSARREANLILASREFNTSAAPSLRNRIIALLYHWLDRLLAHVAAFGSRSPWIGPLIEWSLGGGTGAEVAIGMWQADPTILELMNAALDAGCAQGDDKKIACPAGPPKRNVYQVVLEDRGGAWKVTSFVKAE